MREFIIYKKWLQPKMFLGKLYDLHINNFYYNGFALHNLQRCYLSDLKNGRKLKLKPGYVTKCAKLSVSDLCKRRDSLD